MNQRKIIENILIIEGLWNWDGDLIYQDFGIVWEMFSGFLIFINIVFGWNWLRVAYKRKESYVSEPMISKTRVEGDCKVLPTCVTSALGMRRLLHKGSGAYLAHEVDKSSPEVILDSVPVVWGFSNVLLEDLLGLL